MKKSFCIFLVTFLIHYLAYSQDSLQIKNDFSVFAIGGKEYVVIDINYTNRGDQNIYLWLQNWQFSKVDEDSTSMFGYCGYSINAGLVNAITLKSYKPMKSQKGRFVNDELRNDTLLNCKFIKLLKPEASFTAKIITTDSSFIDVFKNHKEDYFMLIHYCYKFGEEPLKTNDSEQLYYTDDELVILYDEDAKKRYYSHCAALNINMDGGIDDEKDYNLIEKWKFRSKKIGISLGR